MHLTRHSHSFSLGLSLILIVTTLFAPWLSTDALPSRPAVSAAAICTAAETNLFKLFLPLIRRSGATLAAPDGNPLGLPQPDRPQVATATIDPQTAAVLRGKVCTHNGAALPGVTISIKQHPEYGTTLTDADGLFELLVNGGMLLTVNYEKVGYLPAQRQITPAMRDYALLPEVALLTLDANVTTIDLNAGGMQVAQGSVMTDDDGTRQARIFFPAGTQAELVLPGGVTQTLTTLNVRATEYTVGPNGPQAMPAELPPASGYTYALEYSVDEALAAGATEVRFSQPLIHYSENFLGFDTGMAVPTGYYDRDKAAWIGSENGRVVKIVSITGGAANLDTDGDGVIDNGDVVTSTMDLTITLAERQNLATLYQAGQTLWRVPIPHFSAWDCNWPFGPPEGAVAPRQSMPRAETTPRPCIRRGSIIACQNQVLGEVLAVPGTPYQLHYTSDRVPGRVVDRTIVIPLSEGVTPLPEMKRIDVDILIAGRKIAKSFPATSGQSYTFVWDGKDVNGNVVQGTQVATVVLKYVYQAVYRTPAQNNVAFALFGDALTAVRARQEVEIQQEFRVTLYNLNAQQFGLGGWSLSPYHKYDINRDVLYMGTGEQHAIDAAGAVVNTVAGTGVAGFNGEGITATLAALGAPYAVDFAPDGSWYVVDRSASWVRQISTTGIITRVTGTGFGGYNGDNRPALGAQLNLPRDVAVGPDGSLYIADTGNHRIRRIDANGIITTVAGTGATTYNGDNIPATSANLWSPTAIAVGPDGSLYIAQESQFRVRRVSPDGLITTIAGTGAQAGFSNDDGLPASQARINAAHGIAIGPDGSLYFSDFFMNTVRRIGPDGIINTVAGNGTSGFSGDGGPATVAQLSRPMGLAVDSLGRLYITDQVNSRIRVVGTDGNIATLAGIGVAGVNGYNGDGLPGRRTSLTLPNSVAVAPDGSVYIADTGNFRIRRAAPPKVTGLNPTEIVVPAEDGSEAYIFDLTGRHLRTVDPITGTLRLQFGHDASGRLITIADAFSNTTTIQRDGSGNPIGIVAPGGQTTHLALDANGYLSSVSYDSGQAITLTTISTGLLTQLIDPRGGVSKFAYDADGYLIRDENAAQGVTTLTRTKLADGYRVDVQSPLSRTTTYEVRDAGNGTVLRARTEPGGARTESYLRPDGSQLTLFPDGSTIERIEMPDPRWGMLASLPQTVTLTLPGGITATQTYSRAVILGIPDDPFSVQRVVDRLGKNGATTVITFTTANRLITTTTPAGQRSVAQLDLWGRVVSTTLAPGQAPITYTYNASGQLSQSAQGNQRWSYAYDTAQQLSARTAASGDQIVYAYDNVGRLITVTLPSSRTLGFDYDGSGNRTHIVMPDGSTHLLGYDALNQAASYTPPGNAAYLFAHNADHSLAGATLPGGRAVTRSYDASGRVSGYTYPEAAIQFGYADPTDRATTLTRTPASGPAQSIGLSYQGSFVTGAAWSGAAQGVFTYTYNNRFLLTGWQLDNVTLTLGYDADGLLTSYGPYTITRNGPGRTASLLRDNVLTTTLAYDTLARVISRTHTAAGQPVYQMQLSYDNVGRISSKTETVGSTHVFTYTYDADGRLTQVARDGAVNEAYTYDLNGNRLSKQLNAGPIITATYDAQDRLTALGGMSYQFDVDGYLRQRGSDTFRYSARGELISATVGAQTITYAYDALNRRVGRSDLNGTTQYLYGNPNNPFQLSAVRSPGGQLSVFYYDDNGLIFAMDRDGARYTIATDQVGSPRVVADAAGQVVKTIEYDSFGNVVSDSAPGFDLPIGFAGGLSDAATGLVRFGFRDYDPPAGRWTARDPIFFGGQQANLYVYVGNDPINLRDPLGLFCIGVSAYAGIGGGVQTCITSEGASFCGEVGFGVGVNVGVDNGGLEPPGSEIGVEGKAVFGGVGGVGLNIKFDDCGLVATPSGELGPITFDPSKGGLQPTISGGPEWLLRNGKVSAQAKLYGKVCTQGKW